MHPAFSVIFFTTLSGLGYGLWFWLSLSMLRSAGGHDALAAHLLGFGLGFVLVGAGLLSSTLHLGKPLRAWRAFSQWRSSWLSREGVLALASFLPLFALAAMLATGSALLKPLGPAVLLVLAALSLATVACTAMIYASLRPIPAWSHGLVVPGYLLFALHTGGIGAAALLAGFGEGGNLAGLAILASSVLLAWLKRRYWRDIDTGLLPSSRASALGLPGDRSATVFERPHTEANYLTREMGYVLARKHSGRLRGIAMLLFATLPALCALPVWILPHVDATPLLAVAALAALLGAMVERWLFFAEAKHLVTLYY
jgi:DMSO reductase anchor subunit